MKFLTKDAQNELLHGATEKITTRYYELASDTVNVVSCHGHFPFSNLCYDLS